MSTIDPNTNCKKRFNPLKNRLLIYAFTGIMIIGYLLDVIFIDLKNPVYYINLANIFLCIAVIVPFYLKKINISHVVKVQILGLLANLLVSSFFNPVDAPDFTSMFIRNAIIMFMFIPVYGLYCGKNNIFHIGITYLILYISILIRADNHFLANNAPILIFSAVIYHLAIYYIFDTLEKMQHTQIALNKDLESQKELLILKNNDLEQKNEYIFQQANELKQVLATKDKLFSIIAHDLRSPFTILIGFSDIMNNNWDKLDVNEAKSYAKAINDQSKNTYTILENLLNWAGSQTGQIIFKPEVVNISEILQETVKYLALSAKAKNISLDYTLKNDVQLYADKNMLSIILRNLVSNSIKFTPTNGGITIGAEQKSNQIEFTVSDNGVGLDEEKQTKLFIMGATESTNGTEHEKGCGIGLILCKEFVEKHGGEIWVESKKGEGCNFKFTLPLIDIKNYSETKS